MIMSCLFEFQCFKSIPQIVNEENSSVYKEPSQSSFPLGND